jgi:hypothetical protein
MSAQGGLQSGNNTKFNIAALETDRHIVSFDAEADRSTESFFHRSWTCRWPRPFRIQALENALQTIAARLSPAQTAGQGV